MIDENVGREAYALLSEMSMEQSLVDIKSIVADILERWPETAAVFSHCKTACLGCVMGPFCTVGDVASIYHLDLDQLLADLRAAIGQADAGM